MEYFVYILKSCKSGRYYIGYTHNLSERLYWHNKGENRSTKYGIPWEIVYFEKFVNKPDAMEREKEMKSWKSGIKWKAFLQSAGIV